MKLIRPLILLFITICLAGCSEDTIGAFGNGTITGKVVKDGDNEPIENVKISTNPASSTVFSDEDGNFILKDIPEGDYSVQAKKDGLLTKFEGVTIRQNSEVNVIFELKPETANNRQPTAPEAIFPLDKATDVDLNVDFAWSSSDPENDMLTYGLELRNNVDNTILNFNDITDTTYTVEGLNYGYKYFWQVTVSDSINDPVLSPLFSFETLKNSTGRFLFVKRIEGNNVIFSGDGEGNSVQLTSSSSNSFRPRKNLRTGKIAFLRSVGGKTQLFTMNPDGTNQFQLTNNISVNGINLETIGFSFANSGASIVYPNFSNLYQVNIDGSGTQKIYEAPAGRFITDAQVSEDNTRIALLTTNSEGYQGAIYVINRNGVVVDEVISQVTGALGGIDFSVDKRSILYTKDVSGFENDDNRQLDSEIFIYNLSTKQTFEISQFKVNGTNDLDPRFSPNEAEVIFTNTSNDGVSQKNILKINIENFNNQDSNTRTLLFSDAFMPDWE